MRYIRSLFAGTLFGVLISTGAAAHAAFAALSLEVDAVSAGRGQPVTFSVKLHSDAVGIAGVQDDIGFDPVNTPIAAKTNNRPDCAVNPAIHKGGTSFSFLPAGCNPNAGTCTRVRAIVFATDNSDAISDGATLYTCRVNVAASAPFRTYALALSGVVLSDTSGTSLSRFTTINGSIAVLAAPPTPTATATPGGNQVSVNVGTASGVRGQQVSFDVTLATDGLAVAAIQNDIHFDLHNIPISARNGKPDCVVNSAINKAATSFAFLPGGCTGTACTSMRAIVFSFSNSDPIPDGAVLYACKVNIAGNAPFGPQPLSASGIIASDPLGEQLPATGTNGQVVVVSVLPSPTATPLANPNIAVGSASDVPNHAVQIPVFLQAMGAALAAAQVDIAFDPAVAVDATLTGLPICSVNPAIHKDASSFTFRPTGCDPEVDCTAIRAIIIAFDNLDAIPDGVLFTCQAMIRRTARPQTYPLLCSGAATTDAATDRVSTTCTNGSIEVEKPCPGDCDGNDEVTIDELLQGINIALGNFSYDICPAFDGDLDQTVAIDELLRGVVNGLTGCSH